MAMKEEILTNAEIQVLQNTFNHEIAKIINKVSEQRSLIEQLTKENVKLKKYKQNDAEIAVLKAKAAKFDIINGALGSA